MSVFAGGGGGENVKAEVTAQTPIIAEIIEGLVGKAQGATASAETILKGFSAYVGGKLVDGTFKKDECLDGLMKALGFTKMAADKFTFTSQTALTAQVSHSLGQVPSFGFVYTNDEIEYGSPLPIKVFLASSNSGFIVYKKSDGTLFYGTASYKIDTSNTTANKLCFTATNIYQTGKEYTLITMA